MFTTNLQYADILLKEKCIPMAFALRFQHFFFSVFTFRSAEYIQRRKEPLRLQAKYSLIIQQQKMTNPITTKNK